MNISFNSKISEIKNKKIILFGASSCAELFVKCFPDIDILCFVDNDSQKWGKKFLGFKVYNPSIIEKIEFDFAIVISSSYILEINDQLKHTKYYGKVYSALHLITNRDFSKQIIHESINEIDMVRDLLNDEQSKKVFDYCLCSRLAGNNDYRDIYSPNQYFIDEIKLHQNEVFVDCGAYIGDTIDSYISHVGRFEKIYAFEMDNKNYNKMVHKYSNTGNIYMYNVGIWSEKKKLYFENSGNSSQIGEGSQLCNVNSLDNLIEERITYVKMDIEGAEYNALLGAKRIIQKYHPKLAVCIYHKETDLWKIPLLVHNILPEYKLIIRHHEIYSCETVLYAYV